MKNIGISFRPKAFELLTMMVFSTILVGCSQQEPISKNDTPPVAEETVSIDPFATIRTDFGLVTDKAHTYPVNVNGDVSKLRLYIIGSQEIVTVEAVNDGASMQLSSRARPDLVELNPNFKSGNIKEYHGEVAGKVNEADLTYLVTYADGTKKYIAQRVYPK